MSATIEQIGKTYDELPYLSAAFPQTTPEHLRSVAHLFGLDAPAPGRARVLELGCAAGGNIIPFAARHPGAEVVGVDLSGVQIEAGRRAIEAMGLRNIRLLQASIDQLGAELGLFDYVICHGVYSWVPEDIRAAILRVSRERLAPDGVAYVSYNVYPGWKAKEIVRDAMLLRSGPREGAHEKLAYARGMIDFLHDMAHEGSVLKKVMEENIEMIRHGDAHYLAHEFLELCNAPCYFRDFLAEAGRHGMSFLAESEVPGMFAANYGPRIAEPLLRECEGSQPALEQLLDFLNNRAFRQTLLVHDADAGRIRYKLDPSRIAAFHVAGRFSKQPGQPDVWPARNNVPVQTGHAHARRVVETLAAAWPATVPVAELIRQATEADPDGQPGTVVLPFVEGLISNGALRFRLDPVNPQPLAERPSAPLELRRLVKLQDREQAPLTLFNAWHDTVAHIGVAERKLLPLLDGRRDLAELTAAVRLGAKNNEFNFMRDGQRIEQADELALAVAESTERALRWLADHAMLSPPAAS